MPSGGQDFSARKNERAQCESDPCINSRRSPRSSEGVTVTAPGDRNRGVAIPATSLRSDAWQILARSRSAISLFRCVLTAPDTSLPCARTPIVRFLPSCSRADQSSNPPPSSSLKQPTFRYRLAFRSRVDRGVPRPDVRSSHASGAIWRLIRPGTLFGVSMQPFTHQNKGEPLSVFMPPWSRTTRWCRKGG